MADAAWDLINMSNIVNSLYNIRLLDDISKRETFIHNIHPLAKLLTTAVYLAVVVSFDRYELIGLFPFVFYPVIIFMLAELPVVAILKRILYVEPFIIGIGILNPLFDHQTVLFGGVAMSRGWITFFDIFIKCGLTVTVSMIFIATTGINKMGAALRMLRVPKIFVLQLLLTYRYISVLTEELSGMLTAYSLRAPGQKGIGINAWGSFAGQLLLRTFDRAQRVYEAMNLRGFSGEYNAGIIPKAGFWDFAYLIGWSLFFISARIYNLPMLLGQLITGVVK